MCWGVEGQGEGLYRVGGELEIYFISEIDGIGCVSKQGFKRHL